MNNNKNLNRWIMDPEQESHEVSFTDEEQDYSNYIHEIEKKRVINNILKIRQNAEEGEKSKGVKPTLKIKG